MNHFLNQNFQKKILNHFKEYFQFVTVRDRKDFEDLKIYKLRNFYYFNNDVINHFRFLPTITLPHTFLHHIPSWKVKFRIILPH